LVWASNGGYRNEDHRGHHPLPPRIEQLWEEIYRLNFWIGTTEMTALSAVEICMWDILGKSLDAPIYKLLGGPTRERVRLYAHVHPEGGACTPAGFAAGARRRVEQGYTAVKTTVDHLGLARSRGEGEDQRLRQVFREGEALSNRIVDAARGFLGAIRDAVGLYVDLIVDCHGRFGPADAIKFGSALEDLRLLFFEEPCPPENVEALALVSRALKTPVATGERLLGRYGFWPVLQQNAAAVVQPDITNTGGIAETKRIAAMAEVGYMPVVAALPNLRLVSVLGTGTDNFDLPTCSRHGVLVVNTSGASTVSVAELTLALLFAVARHVARADRKLREGVWHHQHGFELRGKLLGIVGLGLIGQEVARLGQALGMRVIAWSFRNDPERAAALGVERVAMSAGSPTRLQLNRPERLLQHAICPSNPCCSRECRLLARRSNCRVDVGLFRLTSAPVDNILDYLDRNPTNVVNPAALQHPKQLHQE
jgi:L-alanine-DL-glutamate epimerase-like enolase superfamily enzyme